MYAFVDRPVTGLNPGCRLLVWAMRSWVRSVGDRQCPGHALAPAFAGLAILAGLQPFMQMMGLVNRHGLEDFRFYPLHHDHVSEHEALILSLLRGIRSRLPTAVRDTLALLVEDDAIAPLLDAIVRLAAAMDDGGMHPRIGPCSSIPRQPR